MIEGTSGYIVVLSCTRRVLSEHMRRLGAGAGGGAARLGVPAAHLWAAPFPRAQLHLRHLPVYRTPRDKVNINTCMHYS